ncbi:ATP-binding protein [Massilia sp. YIM B02443]|uniref:hybrid sensor histidine kinase/response regulator n=1 Tax=Massilia sp. YIM B02443 TaxID=3050127 RepID=UPI0025B65519|nr:ATP-binding protein [Massilia sp. YIM B02443]MDN4039169.1 ATP-binding protein [Massilia sp. YIM B02443]
MASVPTHDDGDLARRLAGLEAENARLRREVDEQRELAEHLREANEHLVLAAVHAQTSRDDAEETNRRQNEFLAMLAHELRNPLVPISVSASLLERNPAVAGTLRQLTGVIGRQVGHMARLLDDLLDAARLSSGKITLAIQPLRLSEVLDQAVETVLPRLRERGQQLDVAQAAPDVVVDGDAVRLTQVFTNLLSNASKYTQDGGRVHVAVECIDGAGVSVRVSDNGSGMAEETMLRAFDLFTQGPRSLARSEGGLGVGLNVVRNLVGMHGGGVSAASPGPGQGSTFTVSLPRSSAAAPHGGAPAPAPGTYAARRILVVEDNADACDVLRMLLELEGHQVAIALDGHAGLALALAGGFDAIVCDIGLPGIDGYELMERLRAACLQRPQERRPLAVALSGYGQPSDRERALAAGFDRYLVKPVAPGALVEALAASVPAAGAAVL